MSKTNPYEEVCSERRGVPAFRFGGEGGPGWGEFGEEWFRKDEAFPAAKSRPASATRTKGWPPGSSTVGARRRSF